MPQEKERKGPNKEIKQDPLIEKLVPDPAAGPDVVVLTGFLGKSAKAGYVRLYLTPKLNDYFEIPEEGVVFTQSLKTDLNPLGGSVVWVKRETELLRTSTAPAQAQADFLRGAIAERFLAGSVPRIPMGKGPRFDRMSWAGYCPSSQCSLDPSCNTWLNCPSGDLPCSLTEAFCARE
jgi:hypothetical protein